MKKKPYDGIVRDPSKPSYILPSFGVELDEELRAMLVEAYGERVTRAWERRNAAFLASGGQVEGGDSESTGGEVEDDSGLTEEEQIELARDLGYDV
jgi:hypothetical protein